ncbi:MAG: hypothetical protein ACE5E5_05355 [Phycisphaerae bacterium]
MTKRVTFSLAMGLSAAGILCFVAGQPRFAVLESTTAKFAGIACLLVAGIFWGVCAWSGHQERE